MATVLTSAIIDQAKGSVNTYVTTANALYQELSDVITKLTSADFVGDAADGYNDFFNGKVKPALQDTLTDPSASLTASIIAMLESIQDQLLNRVDPELGNYNRDPS